MGEDRDVGSRCSMIKEMPREELFVCVWSQIGGKQYEICSKLCSFITIASALNLNQAHNHR